MKFQGRILLLCATLMAITSNYSAVAQASDYRLVAVKGDVQVKRRWRRNYQPAREGMNLRLGDRLRTGHRAQARIQCNGSSTIWSMYQNLIRGVAAGCPNRENSDLRIGKQGDNALGGNDPNIPYVISPRRTAVLNSQLTLHWNAVPEATSYTVQLVGPDFHWETEVSGTQVNYSGSKPLNPAQDYFIVVESDIGSSSQEDIGASIASFQVLHSYDANLVEEKKNALSQESLSRDAYALALADIYIRENLLSDAINTLESLVSEDTELFEVYKTLGDLYRYAGLNLLAEAQYKRALVLASTSTDLEGKSSVQAGLAEVKLMLNLPQTVAVELLLQALDGYKTTLTGFETMLPINEEEEVQVDLREQLQQQIQDVEERLEELT